MLTIDSFIAIVGICLTCFNMGYIIGKSTKK